MIEGFWDDNRPYMRVAVYVMEFSRAWGVVDFLVDTGADNTCLHPTDALRIGVPAPFLLDTSQWSEVERTSGIGGTEYPYCPLDAWYAFRQSNGEWLQVPGKIRISGYRSENIGIPALLGRDVLRRFTLTMHVGHGILQLA